jgi:hypothetical protein
MNAQHMCIYLSSRRSEFKTKSAMLGTKTFSSNCTKPNLYSLLEIFLNNNRIIIHQVYKTHVFQVRIHKGAAWRCPHQTIGRQCLQALPPHPAGLVDLLPLELNKGVRDYRRYHDKYPNLSLGLDDSFTSFTEYCLVRPFYPGDDRAGVTATIVIPRSLTLHV